MRGNRGGRIAVLSGPGLLTFAVRTPDLASFAEAAARAGLSVSDPVAMSRTRPDGMRLAWAVQHAGSDAFPDLIPFAIDWEGSSHPAGTTPQGCTLLDVSVLHPDPEPLAAIYAALGLPVAVKRALRPGLTASLASPRGTVLLTLWRGSAQRQMGHSRAHRHVRGGRALVMATRDDRAATKPCRPSNSRRWRSDQKLTAPITFVVVGPVDAGCP